MKKYINFLLIISLLTVFSGCKKEHYQQIEISPNLLQTKYLNHPDFSRPKNQKPIDNIFFVLNTLKEANYYESSSTGSVEAKKTITLTTQSIKNKRIITPNASFSESISTSTFVKVAEQIYMTNNTILKREAKEINSNTAKWKDTTTSLTQEEYLKQYGYSFTDPTKFIINEETIISDIEILNNGIGRKYTYKFKLDPTIAPYYYKTTVKKLSNSTNEPKFSSIEMTMTFDYKWRIKEITTKEVYKINIPALGAITCHSTLTETFKNFEKHITIDESAFFNKQL